jgi:hypothetical protein
MLKPQLAERALPGDAPTPGRRRARSVTVNLAESPVTWLRNRGMITDRQFAAGEALRQDYERAGLGARVTMQWDAPPIGGKRRARRDPAHATHAQILAKRRFHEAIDAAGPGLSDILWRVVCAGESMGAAEKALRWPARAGRVVLTLALDRVAAYYRVT